MRKWEAGKKRPESRDGRLCKQNVKGFFRGPHFAQKIVFSAMDEQNEPQLQTPERPDGPTHPDPDAQEKPAKADLVCANCGRSLKPKFKFCPDCGQKNADTKVSLRVLISDYVREELHLNNKTLRSLKLFLFRPGQLTVAYMQGQRKNWITPTKLFFWTGFLFLAVLILNIDLQAIKISPGSGGSILEIKAPDGQKTSLKAVESNHWLGSYLVKQLNKANDQPVEFLHSVFRKIPFVLLFILPFFALILKVLFRKRKVLYLEHLVYLLHLHAFGFLAFALLLTLNFIKHPLAIWPKRLILLVVFSYFLVSMRRVYGLTWGRTVGTGMVVFWLYVVLVPVSLLLLSILAGLIGG